MAELFCFIILSCEKESDCEDILFQLLLLCFFVFHFFLVPKTIMVGYMFFFYCSSFPISDVTRPSTFLTYSISGKS